MSRQAAEVLDDSILLSIVLNMNIASSSPNFLPMSQDLTLASAYFLPMWQPCYTSFGAISLWGPENRGVDRSG